MFKLRLKKKLRIGQKLSAVSVISKKFNILFAFYN